MKAALAVVLVALLALPFAAMPAAAEQHRGTTEPIERYTPVVETGQTYRFEGGRWVHVRIGDVSLGVVWSENETIRTGVRLFVDYRRYFGAAELYDEQGNYLRTTGLPLHTILMQEFDRMIEFRDIDNDTLFDFHRLENRSVFLGDRPVKILSLRVPWYLDGPIEKVVDETEAWVNFTLTANDVPYHAVYDPTTQTWRAATRADGALGRISLTFRLAAAAHRATAEVPFYRVYLANGSEFQPTRSEFLENRTVNGVSVAVNGKYDQRVEGWDFGYADSKLALLTPLGFGNFIDKPVVQWLQRQFGGACLKDGSFEHCESDEGPTMPVRIARDRLQVAEGWHRAGEVYWVSNVTVDGQAARMTFEIYYAHQVAINRGDRLYAGFRALGAFVYPQGQSIVHDPGLSASALFAALPEPTNLAPSLLVGLQLVVAAVALIPAFLLRRRARRGRP